jgi:capsular exopolysaccharide synthesis family protein
MSRIQSILEKAEREGSVRRLRNMADPVVGAGLANLENVAPPPLPAVALDPHGASPATPTLGRGRPVTGAQLDSKLIAALAPAAQAAEQYRALRTRILHADPSLAVNVVLVTSPGRSDGKTLTAANLALTMAQDFQRRICVVDANLRHPQLHRLFGLDEGAGLSDILTGRVPLDEALIFNEDHQISILPAGPLVAHPAELLGSSSMRRLLETLRSSFDRVIIDAPPTIPLADVGIVTPLVDTVLLVVRAGMTSRPAIHDAVASIDDAKLLGIVLNETAVG